MNNEQEQLREELLKTIKFEIKGVRKMKTTKQLTLFEETKEELLQDDPNLTELENEIKNYIYENHRGRKNAISGSALSKRFDLNYENDTGVGVRRIMKRIKTKSIIPFDSGRNGYWACAKEKGEYRNGHILKRTRGTIRTLLENDPNASKILFSMIHDVQAEIKAGM